MSIQHHLPEHRYSEAVIANGLIFASGQVPTNPEASAKEQVINVLEQIDALLAGLGSDKTQIVDALIFLSDLADYAALNEVWDAWVAPGKAPARATVQARLANPSWKVEIKIVAAQKSA
jgi:Putative translation initiation inhibitor, yjgF family